MSCVPHGLHKLGLERRIMAGRKSQRAATAEDVARLAGVSRSAVSRSFTPGASVAPATREAVLAAAKALGYTVNPLASRLSGGRSHMIGLVVSDTDNPYRAAFLTQLSRDLVAAGYRTFLLPSVPGEDARQLIDMMLHYSVAGAVVTGDAAPAEIAAHCQRHDLPLVLVNKPPSGGAVSYVQMDHEGAALLAAQAFASHGYRNVGLIGQKRRSYSTETRLEAFRNHAVALGVTVVGQWDGEEANYEGGKFAAAAFLSAHATTGAISVQGLYCANDYMALGVIDGLRAGGLSLPSDMGIVGCDDIGPAGWSSFDLTTTRQDVVALSAAVVAALGERIATPDAETISLTLPTKLINRGSLPYLG